MKIGFIDYFLDEWHANNYPAWISEASDHSKIVKYAYALKDSPIKGGLSTEQWCQKNGVEKCDSIEELVDKSEAIIVLSPDNPEMHEVLSELPLKSGKRTYIDKTFSQDKASAVRMFELAEKYNTPCYSSSALRFASEYKEYTDSNSKVELISSWGPGVYDNYSIHQIEPVLMLMKDEPQMIRADVSENYCLLTLRFDDERIAVIEQFAQGSPFMMQICTHDESKVIEVKSDFFMDFIKEMLGFFDAGKPVVSHEDTIRVMSVREAGLKAKNEPGKWIKI